MVIVGSPLPMWQIWRRWALLGADGDPCRCPAGYDLKRGRTVFKVIYETREQADGAAAEINSLPEANQTVVYLCEELGHFHLKNAAKYRKRRKKSF